MTRHREPVERFFLTVEGETFSVVRASEYDLLEERLDDYLDDYIAVMNEDCAGDEKHCSCVPVLRTELAIMRAELRARYCIGPAHICHNLATARSENKRLRGLLREAVSHVNTHAFSSADRLAERIDAALSAADQPAAVRVCDTCGNPVEVMPFKTHAPHHEPMQHVLCDVCKTAITERRRADQPSAAHLSNIVDKPADQPAAVRDPEAVEIVRCPRCHALPRPSLMGGCVCPNCGTTVLQPVPESAADNSPAAE